MRRRVIAILVILIACVGVTWFIYILPKESTQYHYGESATSRTIDTVLIQNIKDCNVSISFTDVIDHEYIMDIELYEAGVPGIDFNFNADRNEITLNVYKTDFTEWSMGETRIKSVDLILNNRRDYNITIYGTNLNTVVRYNNEARLPQDSESTFRYLSASRIQFIVEDDSFANGSGMFQIGSNEFQCTSVDLDIELPSTVRGNATINRDSLLTINELIGWDDHTNYSDTESSFIYLESGISSWPTVRLNIISTEVNLSLK